MPAPLWPSRDQPATPAADGTWSSWRLLGRNNHELGRSGRLFADDEDCVAALLMFRNLDVREHATVAVRGEAWWWQIELRGERTAVSSRGYQRQRECRYNLEHFLTQTPAATLPVPGAAASTSGRRGRYEAAATVPRHRLVVAVEPEAAP
jgi:hypothetical protein